MSVGHLTADVAWAQVILAERAHVPVAGEELCSSLGLFEAPSLRSAPKVLSLLLALTGLPWLILLMVMTRRQEEKW